MGVEERYAPSPMASLRILSINLLVDRADPDDLRRVISDAEPDVVVTQELGPRTASVITGILPHGHLDPRGDFFGMGVATRYPAEVRRIELDGRSGWAGYLDPAVWPTLSKPLDILDVHLVNPVDRPWRATQRTRRRQIAQIAAFLDGTVNPYVIVGDMNSSPAWPEYRLLVELGDDAARTTGTARRTWSTFLHGPRLLRIDHAFVSGVTPISTSTVRVAGSDHAALIVDLNV